MRVLRRVPERQLTARVVVLREGGARFHGVRDEPLLDDPVADDDLGVRERLVDVAAPGDVPVERLIARNVGVQLRRVVPGGRFWIGYRRQRLVVDLDQVERVVGLIPILGDDRRDDVAGVADDVLRDHLVTGDLEVGVGQQPRAGHRLQLALDVGAGVDGDDARGGRGLARVD